MIDLDDLERLCREATPGPWYEMPQHPYLFCNGRGPDPWHNDIIGRFDYNSEKDRAFIAALRNAAPKLIAMAKQADALHRAICDAVGLLNATPELARSINGREAHAILRQTLIDYADAMREQKP